MRKKTVIVIVIIVGVIVALLALGIATSMHLSRMRLSSNRFHSTATQKRICTDEYVSKAFLPPAFLESLFTLIALAHEAFLESKMAYSVIGGTLLSVVRGNGTLTLWDDDADVAVFASQWNDATKKKEFVDALERRGLRLKKSNQFDAVTERIVFAGVEAKRPKSLGGYPIMDVFVYANNPANLSELRFANVLTRAWFPRDTVFVDEMFPLQLATLRNADREHDVVVPAKPEKVLTRSYGPRWRTEFVIAAHGDVTQVLPCTIGSEQAVRFGLL